MQLVQHPKSRQLTRTDRASAYVFEDSSSKELMSYIAQIAPSEASVLILGETGTGKELVARQIHALSARAKQPFIAVNCGALSENLAETELFGHEKGAFTGAIQQQMGWFEAAQGGTIFLDEIGDLSAHIQVKLLRILQENEIVRVGSRQTKKIDVRIIAATNVDLELAVQAGNFREDLYFRLNVARLNILPLRSRQADILPLVHHFIEEYSRILKRQNVQMTPEVQKCLYDYHWPGNIRELENVIHHALLICKNNLIQIQDIKLSGLKQKTLPESFLNYSASQCDQLLQQVLFHYFEQGIENLDAYLEAQMVKAAYEYCHHNQSQTAKLLGISRNIVRAKLIRSGLLHLTH